MLIKMILVLLFSLPAFAEENCEQEVLTALKEFAEEGAKISGGVGCDTGSFKSGTCMVAGVRLDKSCGAISPDQIQAFQDALRDVRGQGGLGCVNSINPKLAKGLLSVFQRDPPFTICCGACEGQGLRKERVENTSCALTPGTEKDQAVSAALVINVFQVLGKGRCGTMNYDKPLNATLLHEMLHAAGLAGALAHPGGEGIKHPEFGDMLDERDFIPDSVYGCQNTCYGKKSVKSADSCFACSNGNLDKIACDPAIHANCRFDLENFCNPAKNPDCNSKNLNMENSKNYVPKDLNEALRSTQLKAVANDPSVPQTCMQLYNSKGDVGKFRSGFYKKYLKPYLEASEPARKCMEGMKLKEGLNGSMKDFADRCTREMNALNEACRPFNTDKECNKLSREPELVIKGCSDLMHDYRGKIFTLMDVFRTNAKMASRFEGFNCEDYLGIVPRCKSEGPEDKSLELCKSKFAAKK